MSDPIRDLESFPTDGAAVSPLSPAEVRRRGDRLRRRNHAVAAVAGVAAIAVVAVPIAVVTGVSDQRGQEPQPITPTEPDPTRHPGAASWRTDIPEGFPLLVGIDNDPEGSTPSASPDDEGLGSVSLCGREVWPASSMDRLAGEDPALDYHWNRELLLFPSDLEARAAMDQIRKTLDSCPDEPSTDPTVPELESTLVHNSHPDEHGPDEPDQESLTWTDAHEGGAIHARVFQFVRVGSAVAGSLVDSEANIDGVDDQVPMVTEQSRQLVSEMCVFSEHPCVIETEPAEPGQLGDGNLVDPGDLPRLNGMPWQQVDPQAVPTLACQGDWLTELGPWEIVSREFRITAVSADADLGIVNTAVLRFEGKDVADLAYDTVRTWLEECPATYSTLSRPSVADAVAPLTVGSSPSTMSVDRAHQGLYWYGTEPCNESCGARWWDHQTVAQVGDRLVFVSEAEYAGSCRPAGGGSPDCLQPAPDREWKDRVEEITWLVVAAGAQDAR